MPEPRVCPRHTSASKSRRLHRLRLAALGTPSEARRTPHSLAGGGRRSRQSAGRDGSVSGAGSVATGALCGLGSAASRVSAERVRTTKAGHFSARAAVPAEWAAAGLCATFADHAGGLRAISAAVGAAAANSAARAGSGRTAKPEPSALAFSCTKTQHPMSGDKLLLHRLQLIRQQETSQALRAAQELADKLLDAADS